MKKMKLYKNDRPSRRERYWRLFYRKVDNATSNVLSDTWLPATKTRWKTQCREFKKGCYNNDEL